MVSEIFEPTCSFHASLVENLVNKVALSIGVLEGQNFSTDLDEEAIELSLPQTESVQQQQTSECGIPPLATSW